MIALGDWTGLLAARDFNSSEHCNVDVCRDPERGRFRLAMTSHLMPRHFRERGSEFFGHDLDRLQTIDSFEQSL